ncbi:MAG: methylmalonyl Co-A mutase-associated GTPase MeaB [Candidatus Kapaibacteriales bacterium]
MKISIEAKDFFESLTKGSIKYLSKAITYSESKSPKKRGFGKQLVSLALSKNYDTKVLAISGPPGTGKSTFIDSFGIRLIEKGKKVAILAIDPTSSITKGSILGDKTRMQRLSIEPLAFIRPSPTSLSMGGVANATREAIELCKASGFDYIIIETVGVGQSEIMAYQMSDFFLMLSLAGSGDELQGIKKGIVEISDCIAINKIDTLTEKQKVLNISQIKKAFQILGKDTNSILSCSGLTDEGLEDIESFIDEFYKVRKEEIELKRIKSRLLWLQDIIKEKVVAKISSQFKNLPIDNIDNPYDVADTFLKENGFQM